MMDTYCLVNLSARLCDPALGRMLSADSMVPDAMNGQAYNRYSYVLNNPLAMTDPSGHQDVYTNSTIVCYEYGLSSRCWGCSGPGVWSVADNGQVISAAGAQFAFSGGVSSAELDGYGLGAAILNFGSYNFSVGGVSQSFGAGKFAAGVEWAETQA